MLPPGLSGRCRSLNGAIFPTSITTRRCGARAKSCPRCAIALQGMSARGEIPDLATKLRFRAQSAFAAGQAREAIELLWSCYGAQGIYTRDPLQRYLRDAIAMSQHFSFNFDIAG